MATKAQLEAELEALKATQQACGTDYSAVEELEELKVEVARLKGHIEELTKLQELDKKERGRLKDELEKALAFEPEGDRVLLTDEIKLELVALREFMLKLYRESDWAPVRSDIQRWRVLLGKLAE